MKLNAQFMTNAMQALAVGAVLAATAHAGCGDPSSLQGPFQFAQVQPAMLSALTVVPKVAFNASGTNAMDITATPVGM
jgi:hypothetical protein